MARMNVVTAPKTTTFQMRMNPEIKSEAERIYAEYGMSMTDVFNMVLQRTIVEETIPLDFHADAREAERQLAMKLLADEVERRMATAGDANHTVPQADVLRRFGVK